VAASGYIGTTLVQIFFSSELVVGDRLLVI